LIGRAGSFGFRPFFIGEAIEHRFGVVQASRFFGCRRLGLLLPVAGGEEQQEAEGPSHLDRSTTSIELKKGRPNMPDGPSIRFAVKDGERAAY
jgi:hypothetical protein